MGFDDQKSGLRIRIHLIRIRIRIQHFRLNTDPDLIRIQGFDDQKLKKIIAETTIYLSLGHPERASKLQKKPASALKREHTALQNMKFLNFFLFLSVIFFLPGFGSGF
jgi:hypothetical protein